MNIIRIFDRTLSKSFLNQIGLVLVAAILVLGGLIFLRCKFASGTTHEDFLNWILHFINPANSFDPINSSIDPFESSKKISDRYWALIIGFSGMIILSGFLISVFNNIIARRVEKIQNGQISYPFNDHYVIIGFGGMTASIIKQLCREMLEKDKEKDIVLQTAKKVKDVRRQLEVDLDRKEIKRLIIVHGASNSEEDIQKLCVQNTCRIIVLGDDKTEAHDAINMECVNQIVSLLSKKIETNKKIECDVLFNNQSTYAILQKIGIDKEWLTTIHFRPFNFHEAWAQKVIVHNNADGEKINYLPLDRDEGIQYDSQKNVHFVIMGMNNMGIALAVEAARTAHFPNFIRDNSKKTRITFIDSNAEQEMNFFISRYPHLFELVDFDYTDATQDSSKPKAIQQYKNPDLEFTGFLDIYFSFVKGNFESPEVRKLISGWVQDDSTILTIAVCHDDTAKSIATGLYLPPVVFSKQVPVYIRQKETSCLFTRMMLQDDKYKNVRPFGMRKECFSLKINEIEKMAVKVKWVYDTYSNYRYTKNLKAEEALQGTKRENIDSENELIKSWQDDKISNRWSNIYNAFTIDVKDRSFHILGREINQEEIELLAEVEHNRWNVERLIFGFRATTKEENRAISQNSQLKKDKRNQFIHYDIRPYNKLGIDDKGIRANEYDICLSECLSKIKEQNN
jgi:hypothetical protein